MLIPYLQPAPCTTNTNARNRRRAFTTSFPNRKWSKSVHPCIGSVSVHALHLTPHISHITPHISLITYQMRDATCPGSLASGHARPVLPFYIIPCEIRSHHVISHHTSAVPAGSLTRERDRDRESEHTRISTHLFTYQLS